MKINVNKVQKYIKWALAVQAFFAFNLVLYFLFVSRPLIIGEGKFDSIVSTIETIDYRWWVLGISTIYFVLAIFLAIIFFVLNFSNFQLEQMRSTIYKILRGKKIPVRVDINEVVTVTMDKPVKAGFSVETMMNINERVHVKADIPIKLEIPIDTIIETKVLGIGVVKIPIKTTLPMDMNFPFDGMVSMDVKNFKLKLNEEATVNLPPIDVPINAQMDASLNLESNLQRIEEEFKERK